MKETHFGKWSFQMGKLPHAVFILLFLNGRLSAQAPSAESVFDSLACSFVTEMAKSLSRIEGPATEGLKSCIQADTLAPHFLVITSPQVEVQRLNKTEGKRSLRFTAEIRDSLSGIVKEFTYSDTLPLASLKKVPKTQHEWLRTEDPRAVHRLWLPLVLLIAGVAGIITLFYLRS